MITDLTYLKNMTEGNAELIQEMIDIFTVQVKEYTKNMKEFYQRKNWTELSRLAHKAKSSVAIMGMDDLAEMLKKFEMLAMDKKDVEKYPEYIKRFIEDCARACEELKNTQI